MRFYHPSRLYREKHSIFRSINNMISVGFGIGLMRLSTFIVSIIIARHSSPEVFGVFTLFMAVFVLSSEIPNSFDSAYIRYANAQSGSGISDVFQFLSMISKLVVLLVLFLLVYSFIEVIVDVDSIGNEIILVAIMSGMLVSIYSTFVAKYQQTKKFKIYSYVRPLPQLIILLSFYLSVLYYNYINIQIIKSIYLYTGIIIGLCVIFYFFSKIKISFIDVRNNYKKYYELSFILVFTSLIGKVSSKYDVFILNNYLSYAELADYGVGLRVALLVSVLTSVISVLLYPRAPEVQNDKVLFNRYLALSGFYLLIQSFIALLLLFNINSIIVLFFGEAYLTEISVDVSIMLLINMLLTSYTMPFMALIQTGRNPKIIMLMSIARSILTVTLLSFLVPLYGIFGTLYVILSISALFLVISGILSFIYCRPKYDAL